eukprot:2049625-Prymnesium_polylepis.2
MPLPGANQNHTCPTVARALRSLLTSLSSMRPTRTISTHAAKRVPRECARGVGAGSDRGGEGGRTRFVERAAPCVCWGAPTLGVLSSGASARRVGSRPHVLAHCGWEAPTGARPRERAVRRMAHRPPPRAGRRGRGSSTRAMASLHRGRSKRAAAP